MNKEKTLFEFQKESNIKQWQIVNDKVMGGLSMGLIQINPDGKGVFSGHVSLENDGGFCMVRHNLERIAVEEFSAFLIKVKGDGKNYAFRCKSGEHQRHSFSYEFNSGNEWQTIEIPFKEMEAVFRGEDLKMPNYHGDYLAQIAIIIKNGVKEDFLLEIESIKMK